MEEIPGRVENSVTECIQEKLSIFISLYTCRFRITGGNVHLPCSFWCEPFILPVCGSCIIAVWWSLIAGRLPGRTNNEIKHYWNSHPRRKLIAMGFDRLTHRCFQKNPCHHPSATGNVRQPEKSRSHELVEGLVFHCAKSE